MKGNQKFAEFHTSRSTQPFLFSVCPFLSIDIILARVDVG